MFSKWLIRFKRFSLRSKCTMRCLISAENEDVNKKMRQTLSFFMHFNWYFLYSFPKCFAVCCLCDLCYRSYLLSFMCTQFLSILLPFFYFSNSLSMTPFPLVIWVLLLLHHLAFSFSLFQNFRLFLVAKITVMILWRRSTAWTRQICLFVCTWHTLMLLS